MAGIAGIAAMTIVGVYGAPMLGLAPMNPATMLAGVMVGIVALGWLTHFSVSVGCFDVRDALFVILSANQLQLFVQCSTVTAANNATRPIK